jgi:hypothetical protein
MVSTLLDYLRIATAVAVGCGLYDAAMFAVVSFKHKSYVKSVEAERDAIAARVEELKKLSEKA